LGTVAIIRGVAVADAFLFWALSDFCFLQKVPSVLVVQLFSFHSLRIPAGYGYICNSSHLVDACHRHGFVAVSKYFSAWSLGKGIGIVVFSAPTVLESDVLLLQALNPAGDFSLRFLKLLN
jgi:hypothetical protein